MKTETIAADGTLTRKRALWYVTKYVCNFIPAMKEAILEDMIKLKLLKEKDRFRLQIINFEKSSPENIDSNLLVKIIESGEVKK